MHGIQPMYSHNLKAVYFFLKLLVGANVNNFSHHTSLLGQIHSNLIAVIGALIYRNTLRQRKIIILIIRKNGIIVLPDIIDGQVLYIRIYRMNTIINQNIIA